MPRKILFVCSGNTCRSPMAMAIFRKMVEQEQRLRGRVLVDSAGTIARGGLPANDEAEKVMKERSLSLEGHRNKLVSKELVGMSDLILVMDRENMGRILGSFSEARGKTHLLSEFVGKEGNVEDPIGKGVDVYRKTADQIESYLLKLRDKLIETSSLQ